MIYDSWLDAHDQSVHYQINISRRYTLASHVFSDSFFQASLVEDAVAAVAAAHVIVGLQEGFFAAI